MDFLTDPLFLQQLDNLPVKEEYIRITCLGWNEQPIETFEGKVISGSLNIDANSSLRRTANLTMFAEKYKNDLTQIDHLIAINRKVKLEKGFKNTVPNYHYNIVTTSGVEQYQIDYKQQYGQIVWFPLGIYVIFDPSISRSNSGVVISIQLKDKMCLLNGDAGGVLPAAVSFHDRQSVDAEGNAIIDKPLISQIIVEAVHHFGKENLSRIIVSDLQDEIKQVMRWMGDSPLYYYEVSTTSSNEQNHYTLDRSEAESRVDEQYIYTYQYGQEVGYILTPFTYPGELVTDIGATVCDVLDQIIKLLGNYEYFYDVHGNFIFREIKNYLNTTYTTEQLNKYAENYQYGNYEIDLTNGRSVYNFSGTKLISAFSNSPSYSNIKNDFIVWGVRKTTDDIEIPVRYHLAIDKKPELLPQGYYGEHKAILYIDEQSGLYRARVPSFEEQQAGQYQTIHTKEWRQELYYQGVEAEPTGSDYNYYYIQLINEWPKLYDLKSQKFRDDFLKYPASADFYLDMIDNDAEVGHYNVQNIGRRSAIVSEDEINCVFEAKVPDIVFINIDDQDLNITEYRNNLDLRGQRWVQVSNDIYSMLYIGGMQNSCYQRICEMLYQYTNMNETISLTAIPLYYLDVNTRITVNDEGSGIFGDYMISTISLPLDINGTMSMSCYRCLQKI